MNEKRALRDTVGFLVILYGVAMGLPGLAPYDPLEMHLEWSLRRPSGAHPWGTDELGRDVLSRALSGFSTTVRVSLEALVTSLVIGVLLGSLAGWQAGKAPDRAFLWIVQLVMSIPFLLTMAAVLSLTRPTVRKAYLVLTGVMWVYPARMVRAEVMRIRNLPYVLASRALGRPEWQVLMFVVLPRCVGSAVTFSVSYLPEIVALEAGLSFLGLGVQPPQPGLGKMIFDGLNYLGPAWWISFLPAVMLIILTLVIHLFLRRRLWAAPQI